MIDDDNKLISNTLNGNIESFGMLVEKYQEKMLNLALQITNDKDAAKDIAQTAFIKSYQNLEHFNTSKKFFSWIYRITLNESLNYRKHSQYTENIFDDVNENNTSSQEEIERQEISAIVNKAVNDLDDKYKSLIILKHFQELSYEEIAEITDLPISKVKSRLYIARENLRNILQGVQV